MNAKETNQKFAACHMYTKKIFDSQRSVACTDSISYIFKKVLK